MPAVAMSAVVIAAVSWFAVTWAVVRCAFWAWQIGAMERQITEAVQYARERKLSGKPSCGFQAVSRRIAEMRIRPEAARMLLYHAAWLKYDDKSPANGVCYFEYCTDLFKDRTIIKMETDFQSLLYESISHPDACVSGLLTAAIHEDYTRTGQKT
jgi:Acyl-CoA dehydrogenase, C-terminal domain